MSCGACLAPFDIAELRDVTAYDELELDTLGDQKTALFFIMSGTDDSFNFLISMCYATQLLDKYIAYRKIHNQPARHIFPSQRNESLSVPAIEEIFAKYITMAKSAHKVFFLWQRGFIWIILTERIGTDIKFAASKENSRLFAQTEVFALGGCMNLNS